MSDEARELDLVAQAFPASFVATQGGGEELEGHGLPELQVLELENEPVRGKAGQPIRVYAVDL